MLILIHNGSFNVLLSFLYLVTPITMSNRQTARMNRYKKIACCVVIFCFSHQNKATAQPSYHWFQGWWKFYSIEPRTMRGNNIESDLEVTNISGNSYTGIQKTRCSNDTVSGVKMACSGLFKNGDISYKKETEISRTEPLNAYLWNAYAQYKTDTAYFTIHDQKIIFHIKVKPDQKGGITEFAYYRDLLPLEFSLRWQLEKRYGSPQLIDDTVKVIQNIEPDVIDTSFYINAQQPAESLPPAIITRKNTLVKMLTVTSPDIQIILLDDAEIDGDIVSLYHNNELVLDHKTLGKEMIKYTVKADKQHAHHQFILVAENLGSIPPNTALVRIRAGTTKYEFVVHSDMHENVKFTIDYTGE